MTTQLDLILETRRLAGKPAKNKLAGLMLRHLLGVKCWATRREFKNQYEMSSRECRWAVEAARGRIIFSGLGYKAASLATTEEIRVCAALIQSQIRALQEKHRQLLARAHEQLNRRE